MTRGLKKAASPVRARANAQPEPLVVNTVGFRLAVDMGLLEGPKTKHLNAKVSPRLFEAAAKRLSTTSPAVVINAALASLVTEDNVGPWLATNWGILRDIPKEILDQIDVER